MLCLQNSQAAILIRSIHTSMTIPLITQGERPLLESVDPPMAPQTCLESRTPADTIAIGHRIGKSLKPGITVALEGKLGVGKTTLVKGIARALDIKEEIISPSFTIISEYPGTLNRRTIKLFHIDLYRINHIKELAELGLEEILFNPYKSSVHEDSMTSAQSVSIIEWGERAEALLPEDCIKITIHLETDGKRRIRLRGLEL